MFKSDTRIELSDGGSAPFESAPFRDFVEEVRRLDAGVCELEGRRVEFRTFGGWSHGVRLERDWVVTDRTCGKGVALSDSGRAANIFRTWIREESIELAPSETALGRDLLSALRLASDAGAQRFVVELTFPPLSAATKKAIEDIFDARIHEARDCFAPAPRATVKFIIDSKGRVAKDFAFPADAQRECFASLTKAWQFEPPFGGGIIVVTRDVQFGVRSEVDARLQTLDPMATFLDISRTLD